MRFNRTILECKVKAKTQGLNVEFRFNRTILECKETVSMNLTFLIVGFNRTILECKAFFNFIFFCKTHNDLIEPYWNVKHCPTDYAYEKSPI